MTADRARLTAVQADITTLNVTAIVNAANESLLGGGGVDGAIHRAAGPGLLAECQGLGGCPTGQARITGGYLLPARFVIHTVGPVWQGGEHGEPVLLAACYRNALKLAQQNGARTLAFACISTGVYGYPFDLATRIAIQTVRQTLHNDEANQIVQVIFCCFSRPDLHEYERQLSA